MSEEDGGGGEEYNGDIPIPLLVLGTCSVLGVVWFVFVIVAGILAIAK